MRKRKKEKKTAFELPVHKEDKEGLNKPQMTIFSTIRSVVNESTAGILEFCDIVEFRAGARLSKISQSSLSPCPLPPPASWPKLNAPSLILI